MDQKHAFAADHAVWNKGRLMGQKPPLKLREVWAIRTRLELDKRFRDLALFNLAIDSKLRGCDLVSLHLGDVTHGDRIAPRAVILQQKTQQPVQFEITEQTRKAIGSWVRRAGIQFNEYIFPSRMVLATHISTRQYARLVSQWISDIGLDPAVYGTHSLRRTKATLIYRRTKNLRAVQLLLGHRKLESTVKYLGIEVEDALEIAEQTEL